MRTARGSIRATLSLPRLQGATRVPSVRAGYRLPGRRSCGIHCGYRSQRLYPSHSCNEHESKTISTIEYDQKHKGPSRPNSVLSAVDLWRRPIFSHLRHLQLIVHYLLLRTRRPVRCRRMQTRNVEHAECALLLVNCAIKIAQSTRMDLETIHVLAHINLHSPTLYGPLTFSLTDSQLFRSAPTWHRLLPA